MKRGDSDEDKGVACRHERENVSAKLKAPVLGTSRRRRGRSVRAWQRVGSSFVRARLDNLTRELKLERLGSRTPTQRVLQGGS